MDLNENKNLQALGRAIERLGGGNIIVGGVFVALVGGLCTGTVVKVLNLQDYNPLIEAVMVAAFLLYIALGQEPDKE